MSEMNIQIARRQQYTVLLEGGIGNQLFQFFAVLTLARKKGIELCVDDSFIIRNFNGHGLSIAEDVSNIFACSRKTNLGLATFKYLNIMRRTVFLSQKLGLDISSVGKYYFSSNRNNEETLAKLPPGKTIRGYFQSLNLIDQELVCKYRESFNFNELPDHSNLKRIGIHIRGGDYRKGNTTNGLVDIEYYTQAIASATSEEEYDYLLLFYTDDYSYTMSILGNLRINELKYEILTSNSFKNDLAALQHLSSQNVIIIANSTFSLWSAYLSKNREIYAPSKWDLLGTNVSKLYFPEWKIINAEISNPNEQT